MVWSSIGIEDSDLKFFKVCLTEDISPVAISSCRGRDSWSANCMVSKAPTVIQETYSAVSVTRGVKRNLI